MVYLFMLSTITMNKYRNEPVFCYIEVYDAQGQQILGNLDGQAVIRTANYRRTVVYKRLATIIGNSNWMNGRVQSARIVRPDGRIIEVVNANTLAPA